VPAAVSGAVVAAPAAAAEAPAATGAEKEAEPSKGSSTGSPLPRFATLRSDDVNLRSGPGTRYPIDWVYKRRDLPVVIEREFDMWRLVRDPEGVKGWVNQATLAPRRSGVVTASGQAGGAQMGGAQTMRSDPSDTAGAVAVLKPGVIVRLRSCEATSDWCQVSVQDYRGWLRRTQFWGTLPGEAVQ
jgi:SH3-like domain-containing protein